VGLSPAEHDIVLLTGGTGGAKLARGIAEAFGPERLSAIVNTGDDIEIYGANVSPDPDLVCFWLAGLIDERGWGIEGDTFMVMDGLRELGNDVWFNLGDRDLAWCIERARMLAEGHSPRHALARLGAAIGVSSRVLPMSDGPVRTWVQTPATGWCAFQPFMIRERAQGPVEGLEFRGAESAAPGEGVLEAIEAASVILIGPSNPLASIAPILAVPGIREALVRAAAPVVAISPIVGGEVLKGPTRDFMAFAGLPASAAGVRDYYGGLLDGLLADEPLAGLPSLQTDTRMADGPSRMHLARAAVAFAEGLRRPGRADAGS
jgi:LPPG:FO 2-phospho-L-lactate transferase